MACAVVRTMDDKTAGAHRPEAGKALGDPIGVRDPLEAERARRRFAGGNLDQSAQAGFIGGSTKVHGKLPAPIIALEGGTGSVLRIEGFTEIAGEPPGGGFVAGQAGDGGGRVHAV